MKRGLSLIVVPACDGGMVFSVCAMSYPDGTTPVIDVQADNLRDATMIQEPDDDAVVAWMGRAMRRAAALFELEMVESPDKPAPWPVQLGLFGID